MKKDPDKLKAKMFELVDQWRSSGLTRQAFCIKKDISIHILRYWITKYNKESTMLNTTQELPVTTFSPIRVSDEPKETGYTVIYPNGVSIKCNSTIDLSALKSLIELY